MSRECTQPRTQLNAGVVCQDTSMSLDHDFFLRVTLARRTVDCLLDTGSEVCLIPDSLVPSDKVKKTKRSLRAANGTPIPILGEAKLSLSIGNFNTVITALVLEHVSEPMLGIDFLVKNHVIWDFAESTVFIHGVPHLLSSRENKQHWCRRVVVQETTILPASSETVIPTKVQFKKVPDLSLNANWCTEIGEMIGGVQVSRTLVPHDAWCYVPVRVLNTGVSDVKLQMNMPISNLEQVEVLEPSDHRSEQVCSATGVTDQEVVPEYIEQEAQLTLWVADRTAPSHISTITRYVFERSTASTRSV